MNLELLLLTFPPLIFSIVVHEVAHGWVALKQGDNTAAMLGRLTLNPVPHIDPLGSILVPGLLALTGAPVLGWAKPVPTNPRNYRDFKRGDILVSLAGVASNLVLGFVFAFLAALVSWLMLSFPAQGELWANLQQMFVYGVGINFILMIFNLIPVPPLDGSHVFYYLLPPRLGAKYRQLGMYGMLVLYALIFLGALGFIMVPVRYLMGVALSLAGLVAPG